MAIFECVPACAACVTLGSCVSGAADDDTDSGAAFEFACFDCDTPQDGGGECADDDCEGSVEMVTE